LAAGFFQPEKTD